MSQQGDGMPQTVKEQLLNGMEVNCTCVYVLIIEEKAGVHLIDHGTIP